MIILITGGARSGKSAHAERRALALPGAPHYIATAQAGDEEMAARIAAHRTRRGPGWQVAEVPLDLPGALEATDGVGPRLVDCLTLWLSNLMVADMNVREEAARLCAVAKRQVSPVVFVTNEVGMGIVPDNALARRFRDEAGWLNQEIAALADEVQLAVSGYLLRVK
ncbi:MAG: bifunctional adenosylcobinamide kinase/adenosylcobinamide-phosphate guanylyltransferase [Rhodospirillales bacterium]|nr:bifunctional adenosylcobinamide kinase/adenosylcobinamide-phosphate guanylyltransferase [Rhodospirillales bacterium]MDE1882786.1 bifunctional adenosylcobinamide kinase/adenosylcobinamide-phosphate guanylyltransferase [Rhodospirillales bacterium]